MKGSEIKQRQIEFDKYLNKVCETQDGRHAVNEIIKRNWNSDAARYEKLHGEDAQ